MTTNAGISNQVISYYTQIVANYLSALEVRKEQDLATLGMALKLITENSTNFLSYLLLDINLKLQITRFAEIIKKPKAYLSLAHYEVYKSIFLKQIASKLSEIEVQIGAIKKEVFFKQIADHYINEINASTTQNQIIVGLALKAILENSLPLVPNDPGLKRQVKQLRSEIEGPKNFLSSNEYQIYKTIFLQQIKAKICEIEKKIGEPLANFFSKDTKKLGLEIDQERQLQMDLEKLNKFEPGQITIEQMYSLQTRINLFAKDVDNLKNSLG